MSRKTYSAIEILRWIDERLERPDWRQEAVIMPGSLLHQDIKACIARHGRRRVGR